MNRTLEKPWRPNPKERCAEIIDPAHDRPANCIVLPRSTGIPRVLGKSPMPPSKNTKRINFA